MEGQLKTLIEHQRKKRGETTKAYMAMKFNQI
jgi:hypothetical protein